MINVEVKMAVSEDEKYKTFEINLSQEEWDAMSEEEKRETLTDYIYDLPEQPYWVLDKYNEL